jgi:CheY-like chemotaxis protein
LAKSRILVVDDEQGMLEVCAASLKKLPNATVLVEPDSRRAVRRLADESFDGGVAAYGPEGGLQPRGPDDHRLPER